MKCLCVHINDYCVGNYARRVYEHSRFIQKPAQKCASSNLHAVCGKPNIIPKQAIHLAT